MESEAARLLRRHGSSHKRQFPFGVTVYGPRNLDLFNEPTQSSMILWIAKNYPKAKHDYTLIVSSDKNVYVFWFCDANVAAHFKLVFG